LESLEDGQLELAPDIFGNILHQVLNQYGTWRMRNFSGNLGPDAAPVEVFLLAELEAAVEKHLSRPTFPAIGFQIQRLRRRLSAFAAFEAARATEGWRIHQVESSAEISLPFDGFNFRIEGRVDRIDCSADGSTYRIIDYKSGDSGKKPDEIHRAKQGDSRVWIDLQLPLYRRLAPGLNIPESAVEVGYLVLPKDLGKVKWLPAEWTEAEFQEAYTTADTIIRAVHAGKFWPPAETLPAFNDGLSSLCRDTIIGRTELLTDTSGPPLKWTSRRLKNEAPANA
jgi:hypothetical protein